MSAVDNTKPKGQKPSKKMLVSYGRIGTLGWFEHNEAHISKLSSHVVIKTKRGLELGEIVGVHNYRGGQFRSSPKQVEQYYSNRTKDYPLGDGGRFVRFATPQDLSEQRHLEKNAIGEAKTCQRITEELGLQMKIVEAEHLFGGERIIFYFTSENRVDFRELVRRLATEYQTRIELRQIGSRDEARLISDYESCGQQCCCSRFLKILEPVNMRMAKIQKATLDPSKISGHCGRLKCCLRYEDKNYIELKRKMPHRSTPVQTPKGRGKIVDMQILTQVVVVQMETGDRQAWPLDEVEILKPGQQASSRNKPEQNESSQDRSCRSGNEEQGGTCCRRPSSGADQTDATASPCENASSSELNSPEGQGQKKQNEQNSQQPGKRQGNKNRRRRSKNKQGGSKNNQNNPNNQNDQKPQNNRPAQDNNRQQNEQKPSDGSTAGPSGE